MLDPQQYDKRAGWKRLYDWDFSAFDEFSLAPAETGIASVTVTVAGDDPLLVLGAPAISGMRVQMLVSEGTPGIASTITVAIVTTPGGFDLNLDGIVNVIA